MTDPIAPPLRYFDWAEFACKCGCGENKFRADTATRADNARHLAGVPFSVNSAYRCAKHNAAVGSRSDVHPRGYAIDIAATDSRTRYKVITGLLGAGFTRIGLGKGFIHADDDPTKAQEVAWEYS